jgi:hypothetical protein
MKFIHGYSIETLVVPLLTFIPLILADVQILNVTASLYPTLSSTCLAVLNQAVACDSAVLWAGRGRFEDDATLSTLCTSTCSTSLATWHRRVGQTCKDRVYNGGGYFVLPQLWSVQYLDEYNLVCLQHKWVADALYQGLHIDGSYEVGSSAMLSYGTKPAWIQ